MAKSKAPEKKQLRWIKRHKVGIGSRVRILHVPSEDKLKGFPDFDMNRIRQFQGTHNWACIHFIWERAITIKFDRGDGRLDFVDVPYFILDVGVSENNTATTYVKEQNKKVGDFLGKTVVVTRKAHHGEGGWGSSWLTDMDDYVGGYFRVVGVSIAGMALSKGDEYAFFPHFVLEREEGPYWMRECEWIRKNSITKNTKVKITKSARSFERGWGREWDPEMSSYLGLIGEVVYPDNTGGGVFVQFHDGKRMYSFPYFVLEKVPDSQPFTCSDTVKPAAEKLVERYDSVIREMISSGKQPPKRTEPVTETKTEWIEKHQVREGTEVRVIWNEETSKRPYSILSGNRCFITRTEPAIFVECPDLSVGGFVPYWDLQVVESKFPTFEEWSKGEKDLRGRMFRTASGRYGVILSPSPIGDDLVVRISGNGKRYVLPYYALELI